MCTADIQRQTIACHGCRMVMARNNAINANGFLYCSACVPVSSPPASAMPPWGNWPNIVQPVSSPNVPDFGANVSEQLAKQRGIDKAAANDAMRVPSFAEKEAERLRMAEHFRRNGVL